MLKKNIKLLLLLFNISTKNQKLFSNKFILKLYEKNNTNINNIMLKLKIKLSLKEFLYKHIKFKKIKQYNID